MPISTPTSNATSAVEITSAIWAPDHPRDSGDGGGVCGCGRAVGRRWLAHARRLPDHSASSVASRSRVSGVPPLRPGCLSHAERVAHGVRDRPHPQSGGERARHVGALEAGTPRPASTAGAPSTPRRRARAGTPRPPNRPRARRPAETHASITRRTTACRPGRRRRTCHRAASRAGRARTPPGRGRRSPAPAARAGAGQSTAPPRPPAWASRRTARWVVRADDQAWPQDDRGPGKAAHHRFAQRLERAVVLAGDLVGGLAGGSSATRRPRSGRGEVSA